MECEELRNLKAYKREISQICDENLPWQDLRGKTILITGATGLIGTYLSDVFIQRSMIYGDNLTLILVSRNNDRARRIFGNEPNVILVSTDISKGLDIRTKVDYIIHAASDADPVSFSTDPIGVVLTNFMGTLNLLNSIKDKNDIRFVFLSTGEVYGDSDKIKRESDFGSLDPNSVRSCYPESKRGAENLLACFKYMCELDYVIIRLCHIFGATFKKEDSRAYAQFLRNAIDSKDIILKSSGEQMRSMCYVSDAVSGILYAMFIGESGEAYNLANRDCITSIRKLAALVASEGNVKVIKRPSTEQERLGFSKNKYSVLDASKLESLGWKPKVNLQDGIKRCVYLLKSPNVLSR